MKVEVRIKGKKVFIGTIEGQVFRKSVIKSKHLFRKFDSWGFDYYALVNFILPNCNFITIYDKEEKKHYATMPNVFGKFEETKFKPSKKVLIRNYGKFGVQVFLPRRYWWQSGDPLSLEKINDFTKERNA